MADLCTLEEVKGYLDFSEPDGEASQDDELTRLITFATGHLAGLVELAPREDGDPVIFQADDYTDHYDGPGGRTLLLRRRPLLDVTAVTVNGHTIPAATTPGHAGFSFNRYAVQLCGYVFARGMGNVAIACRAGYADGDPTLDELRQAAIEIVSFIYRTKATLGKRSEHLGGQTVTYASTVQGQALPARVQLLVQRLRPRMAA